MARVDRLMRRVAAELEPDEAIVASCLGVEADGRRRRLVVLTDRRLFVAWARGGAHTFLVREQAGCTFEEDGGRLTLGDAEHEVVLRGVSQMSGRTMAQLISPPGHESEGLDRVLRVIASG